MNEEQSGSTDMSDILNADIPAAPGYLTYVVLVYRLVCAVIMIGLGGLVVSTIVKTRALHNVHNILIVNLMASDIIGLIATTFQTMGMTFTYIIGVTDPFRCDVLHFTQFSLKVNAYTFVMLSVDKFIAIKFALRYNSIVTRRRAYLVIAIGWIIAVFFRIMRLTYELAVDIEYNKSSQFGSCLPKQQSILVVLFSSIIPFIIACCITIILDIYLSIKAYQIHKRIQQESGEERKIFKDKLKKTLQQLKPMITLLVTILGSMAISTVISIVVVMITNVKNKPYQILLNHLLVYNIGYLGTIVHPLVYGLYFHDIRQTLFKRIKYMVQSCKFNVNVSSQP